MLKAKNVSYKNILKNISFWANRGTVTGIIGENGSGKTTFLKALSGFLKFSGRISVNGKDIKKIPVNLRTSLINYLPQEFPQTELTPFDILNITGEFKKIHGREIKNIISSYNLTQIASQPFLSLSGGEKVRVFLAKIELINPLIVLLDEPSAFLDIKITNILKKFVERMKRLSKTVIIVSNDLNFTINISNHIVGIKNGSLISQSGTDIQQFLEKVYETKIKLTKIDKKYFIF